MAESDLKFVEEAFRRGGTDMAENKIPERIWVQWYGEGEPSEGVYDDEPVTWCVDKINEHDVCYVTEESAVLQQQRNHAQGYREGFAAAGKAIVTELQGANDRLSKITDEKGPPPPV